MGGVIGRNTELDAIESFLASLRDGPAALVLAGEPGIGKTTLMRAGVAAAKRHGARVLACGPSASETRLSYAALGDLLSEVPTGALKRLPPPQRHALDAALLRSDPGTAGVAPRAVATAALSLLEALVPQRRGRGARGGGTDRGGGDRRLVARGTRRRPRSRLGDRGGRRGAAA